MKEGQAISSDPLGLLKTTVKYQKVFNSLSKVALNL